MGKRTPITGIFDYEHILTPIAVEHTTYEGRTYRQAYIFGVRIAFWATTRFKDS